MSKVKVYTGWEDMTPGPEQILYVKDYSYNKEFKKLRYTLVDENGATNRLIFNLDRSNKHLRITLNSFSSFGQAVLNDYECKEIDMESLVGHFVMADVIETEPNEKGRVFINLKNFAPTEETFEVPEEVQMDEDEEYIFDSDDEDEDDDFDDDEVFGS